MKRWIVIVLCVVISVALGYTMFGTEKEAEQTGYKVFFREKNLSETHSGDALRPELVDLPETDSAEERIEQLMAHLLGGPKDETLQAVVPAGTTLLSARLQGVLATVDLSGQYGALSGVALTLADYAITQTLTQLPQVMLVQVTVRGRELPYRNGRTLSQRDILFSPKEDIVSNITVKLYFPDAEGELHPEDRILSLYEGETQVGAVVRAVEKGPENKELLSVVPENFRVRSVWQVDNDCYVNFSSAQLESFDNPATLDWIKLVLERSLHSLGTVEKVFFLVDGEMD